MVTLPVCWESVELIGESIFYCVSNGRLGFIRILRSLDYCSCQVSDLYPPSSLNKTNLPLMMAS